MLDLQHTVASVVLDHSECAPVFQRHRIDFCCRGDRTVTDACREQRIEPEVVQRELEQAIADRRGDAGPDPRALSTAALVAHIVSRHHVYLREALPFLRPLAAKVARVHGDRNPRLREIDAIVGDLAGALLPHLDMEEETLFPALVLGGQGDGIVARELSAMREEHLAVGRLLERLRGVAEDYRAPAWACNSYRTLFSELERLEGDVLQHVHLENHVLMPRFT